MQQNFGKLTRRGALKSFAGFTALAMSPQVPAMSDGQRKVWLDMTQEELDTAYSQLPWAPNMMEVWARYGKNSDLTRSRIGEPERLSYGEAVDDTLDLYATKGTSQPVHVFVHGGAWITGNARDHGFLAETFVNAGAHFVAINYASVEDTDGRLAPLADQVRRAIAWVYRNAGDMHMNRDRIFLSGHSAGAHLAGVAMTTDWSRDFGLPQDVVKAGLLISGMFDLEPVCLSDRREYVRCDVETIHSLSPQRHLDRFVSPAIVTYGTLESPEFQRQSRDFADAARGRGKQVDLLVAENYNHMEILETLGNPYGLLGSAALRQMGLDL